MYTKLFSSITESTIWREEDHTRLLWITMLAMADKNGHVMASVPGLADRAHITIEKTVQALKVLSEPDQWSRSKEFEGKRIEEIGGGWLLLNYTKYSRIRDADQRREYMRKYMREWRKKPEPVNTNVNRVSKSKLPLADMLAHTDTDTNTYRVEKGEKVVGGNGHKKSPPPKFAQSDFDQRDMRLLAAAEKELLARIKTKTPDGFLRENMTEQEFFTNACDMAGITVARGLEIKKLQREWPKEKIN